MKRRATVKLLACCACLVGILLASGCGGSEEGTATGSGTSAVCTEGAYKCEYTGSYSFSKCTGGQWTGGGGCTCSVSVGDPRKPPYASTCKYHDVGSIECSYAGSLCMLCAPGTGCVAK